LQLSVHGFKLSQNGEIVLLAGEHIESHIKVADDEAQSHHQYYKQGCGTQSSPKHIAAVV
jgi:hypothetical protein